MIFGSVCSGIEAASVAWHPLGWRASFYSEIDAFPRAVLRHHYPTVPLHGDFTTIEKDMYEPIDLLCGGTPCQSFSIAGLRRGLTDDRGNLSLEFIRLAERLNPRWLVWENVPGVLSSNKGRDFGAFLGGLAECGYGFAYRVLDAQYFGVPQRRRRVVLVGYIGNWRPAAAVLFERESLRGDITPRREKGKAVAGGVSACFDRQSSGEYGTENIASTMSARDYKSATDLVAQPIPIHDKATRSKGGGRKGDDGSSNGLGIGQPGDPMPTMDTASRHAVAHAFKIRSGCEGGGKGYLGQDDMAFTVATGQDQHLMHHMAVRRLTPRECERLQGFSDDFTLVPYRGKPAKDGPRYKAIGNSWAVPKFRWLGERIEHVDNLMQNSA